MNSAGLYDSTLEWLNPAPSSIALGGRMFEQIIGQRPAIDVGISVSRVGGAAQVKAMKSVSGSLRIDLSQYRELEAFAAFASDLDAASRAQLDRGARLVELLKQPQYSPYSVEKQVVSIWSGTSGELDDVPVEDIRRFEAEFLQYVNDNAKGVLPGIRESKKLSDDALTTLKGAISEFKKGFTTGAGTLLGVEDEVEALDQDQVEQETIARVKKA
jgi:F-type H+-transporting ATPase subunit alpha